MNVWNLIYFVPSLFLLALAIDEMVDDGYRFSSLLFLIASAAVVAFTFLFVVCDYVWLFKKEKEQ